MGQAKPSQHYNRPWQPFQSLLDFEMAELILETAMNKLLEFLSHVLILCKYCIMRQ